MKLWNILHGLALGGLLTCLGCTKVEEPAPADPASTAPAPAGTAETSAPSSQKSAAPDPSTPDGAVLTVTQGLSESRPQVLWEALPSRYQAEINEVVQTSASNADAELWNRSVGLIRKLAATAKDKKPLLVSMAAKQQNAPPPKQVEQAIDGIVALLETLVNSELGDINRLKTVDVGQLLSGSGVKIIDGVKSLIAIAPLPQPPFEALAGAKAKVVSQTGDSAVVSLEIPGNPAEEREMTRVDGKWLPADIVENWDEAMAKAKEQAAKPSELTDEQKQALNMALDSIDQGLDTIAAAKTEEELQGAFMQVAMPLMMMLQNQGQPPPGSFDSPAPTEQDIPADDAAKPVLPDPASGDESPAQEDKPEEP